MAAGLALALALAAVGCKGSKPAVAPPQPQPDKHYGEGPDGLRELWMDVLTAARKDERDRVHDLMQTMAMTDEDLVALFGTELAAYLKPRYRPMINRMVNPGALELVAQIIERKYDDVEVILLRADSPDIETRASLAVLKVKTPAYSVRLKQKGDTRGLRYDFFVYRAGRWVTGNQFARFFAPPNDTSNTPSGFVMPATRSTARPATATPGAAPAAPPTKSGQPPSSPGRKGPPPPGPAQPPTPATR